jgi:hypothetical protein
LNNAVKATSLLSPTLSLTLGLAACAHEPAAPLAGRAQVRIPANVITSIGPS